MKYLTVGTSEIKNELFRNIEDTDPINIKPRGGLWLTKYENDHYNEWIDFLIDDPVVLYYKSKGYSMWKQPCSLVTLSNSVNLFDLNSKDKLEYLINNYPLNDNKFSYESISHIYDGIYVNMYNMLRQTEDRRFYKFGVDSLILFNLDCIDYYQSGIVLINPFDYEYGSSAMTEYEIKIDNVKKRILK